VTWWLLPIYAHLIVLHAPNGDEIHVNPDGITALRTHEDGHEGSELVNRAGSSPITCCRRCRPDPS
jgi:hypothetical protein